MKQSVLTSLSEGLALKSISHTPAFHEEQPKYFVQSSVLQGISSWLGWMIRSDDMQTFSGSVSNPGLLGEPRQYGPCVCGLVISHSNLSICRHRAEKVCTPERKMVILVDELAVTPPPYPLPSIKIYFFASFFVQGEVKKNTQGRQVQTLCWVPCLYGLISFPQQPFEVGFISSVL